MSMFCGFCLSKSNSPGSLMVSASEMGSPDELMMQREEESFFDQYFLSRSNGGPGSDSRLSIDDRALKAQRLAGDGNKGRGRWDDQGKGKDPRKRNGERDRRHGQWGQDSGGGELSKR